MTTNLERIEYEFKAAGYDLNKEEFDYGNECAKSAYEICKLFAEQGHSGFSAQATLSMVKKLLIDEDTLTPLTDNPDEWECVSVGPEYPLYQSKRNFKMFSPDLKSYYNTYESEYGVRKMYPLKKAGE